VRRSVFDLTAAVRPLWPGEFREQLGIRSSRTLDAYLARPGFPRGRLEAHGRVQVRVFTTDDVVEAQRWLTAHRLPGQRAGKLRIANLNRLRTSRAEVKDLQALAGRLLRCAGPEAVADAIRPTGFSGCGFDSIPEGHRTVVRQVLVRALALGS
jgi:hypothetical protein